MVPDETTMPALTYLLGSYESGKFSYRTLAQDLNAKGYLTADGKPFTEGSISTVLDNRFYDGKVIYYPGQPDEEIREGVHEVPDEVKRLWRQCQQIKSERSEPGWYSPPVREHRV